MALKVIEEIDGKLFVIISDLKSVLKTIQNIRNNHPLCRKMIHDIYQLQDRANKSGEMCWVPSHIGISDNEKADEAAVTAARRGEEYIAVYYKDWYHVISRDGRAPGEKERRSRSRSLLENGAELPLLLLHYKRSALPLQQEKSALLLTLLSKNC